MTLIAWLVIGAIAGYVANYFLGTRQGVIMTVIFGIVGAIVGGLVGSFLTGGGFDVNALLTGFNIQSVIVAILGALGLGALGGWWSKRNA
jgi:uncharacterized membrane protein YeaQ/YmgE (transglycosylase-associated protein family)